jgi:chaperonin GroEL
LKARVKELSERIKNTKEKHDIKQLTERRATLQGKVAIIKVGGNSETEIGEKKDRVNDAVFAAKAALDEGTVPGGATTLLLLSKHLPENSLLRGAMEKPFQVLLENAGLDVDDWKDKITLGFGIDTNNPDKLVDLRKKGIIDPTKTVRVALENAVSVAGTGITMKTIIVEIPEEKKNDN